MVLDCPLLMPFPWYPCDGITSFVTLSRFENTAIQCVVHLIPVATTVSVYMSGVGGRRTVVVAVNSVGATSSVRLTIVAGEKVESSRLLR